MTNRKLEKNTGAGALFHYSNKCQIKNPEYILMTAGGKIKCRRCVGVSSRSKQQCKHPALKTSKASRCKWHSGASTGPLTKEGKDSIRAAHWKDGTETREARAERKKKFFELNQLASSLGV
jgi:hypothetical protein